MDESLRVAAQEGKVDSLYSLIQRDAKVLDKIGEIPFVQTPLHVAAAKGQTKFAMELLRLKRSFSKKLNQEGYTPMHLALQHEQIEMVRCLLDFDEELVRIHGKNGMTPLHYVAQVENLELLAEFLRECPRSVEDVTNGRETVMHVALKSGKFEAFRLLLGWVRRTWFKHAYSMEKKLLNAKDEEGNTVLHIAVAKNLPQIVELLLKYNSAFHRTIDIQATNSRGFTAFDMLQGSMDKDNEQIKYMLPRAKSFFCCQHNPTLAEYFRTPVQWEEKTYVFFLRQTANISDTTRNALLVVAVLLLTITYQATVSPPGGVWQQNSHSITQKTQHSIRAGFNSGFYTPPTPYAVGTATIEENVFILISVLNCVSFFVSIFSLILLLPTDFRSGMFGLPLCVLSLCFLAALFITAPVKIFPFHVPPNYYILFCVFAPLLFLALQGIVLYRQKKVVSAFIPRPKELDPNLHMSSTLF